MKSLDTYHYYNEEEEKERIAPVYALCVLIVSLVCILAGVSILCILF